MTKQNDFKLHALMCVAGGIGGVYSLLRCTEGFGAAQTANLIYMVTSLLGGDGAQFFLHLLGGLFYMAGIETYILVTHKTSWNPEKWALLTEMACVAVIGLLPEMPHHYICLYLVFYMMAVQWSVFHGACGYTSATIFSSNNVKQFSMALGNYLCDKETEQARKAQFFGLTLLFYHIGVAIVFIGWYVMKQSAIWLCFIPLLGAAYFVYGPVGDRKKNGGNDYGYEPL